MPISMRVDMKVKTDGLDKLIESCTGISDVAGDEVSRYVVVATKARTPVRTGNLRRRWGRGRIGVGKMGGWRIYNTAFYAPFIEFGTVKMPPRPMLQPSVMEARRLWSGVIGKLIMIAVTRVIYPYHDEGYTG